MFFALRNRFSFVAKIIKMEYAIKKNTYYSIFVKVMHFATGVMGSNGGHSSQDVWEVVGYMYAPPFSIIKARGLSLRQGNL